MSDHLLPLQVTLYQQMALKSPVLIFLSKAPPQPQYVAEIVESTTALDQIALLLKQKGLADNVNKGYSVIVKRADGSTFLVG